MGCTTIGAMRQRKSGTSRELRFASCSCGVNASAAGMVERAVGQSSDGLRNRRAGGPPLVAWGLVGQGFLGRLQTHDPRANVRRPAQSWCLPLGELHALRTGRDLQHRGLRYAMRALPPFGILSSIPLRSGRVGFLGTRIIGSCGNSSAKRVSNIGTSLNGLSPCRSS